MWIDRLVTWGILFLILFSPLAFGSVHPWAFASMEAVIFLLVMVWMVAGSKEQGAASTEQESQRLPAPCSVLLAKRLALPLVLFFAVVLFQLLPLPPGLLRALSPATFELYSRSLSGWPDEVPYGKLLQIKEDGARSREQGDQASEISDQGLHAPHSLLHARNSLPSAAVLLPTLEEVRSGAPVPFESSERRAGSSELKAALLHAPCSLLPAFCSLLPPTWLPLSIAPSRTRSDLLKLAAYSALFFLILLYPFGESSEQGAERSADQRSAVSGQWLHARGSLLPAPCSVLIFAVLSAGLLVAALGFVQRFWWNGKILWFFIPYDWGFAHPGGDPRASGPFVNPDHFANYLAIIFPLAVGLVWHTRAIAGKQLDLAVKIFSGLTAFVAFASILLSLSRGGWMMVCLSTALLLWLVPWPNRAGSVEQGAASEELRAKSKGQRAKRREQGAGSREAVSEVRSWRPEIRRQRSRIGSRRSEVKRQRRFVLRGSLMVFCALLMLALFFVGQGGREQVDVRLQETVMRDLGIGGRAAIWRDSLEMVGDFPLAGVGLGSWQELFQRYRRAPWSGDFYREAHNDYLELLAETGVIGFLLLGWFFLRAGRTLFRFVRSDPASENTGSKTLAGMLLAAMAAMAFHEFFDFSLQIPANAFLFTVLLALALRLAAGSTEQGAQSTEPRAGSMELGAASRPRITPCSLHPAPCFLLSLILFVSALSQEMTPYPYNLKMPGNLAEAREMVLAHPALPTPHLYLLRLAGEKPPLHWQLNELRAALWLDPTSPAIRDAYALAALQSGEKETALREITQSVLNAPWLSAHYFLNGRILPWLSEDEKSAVEAGFKKAMALDYHGASGNLGSFYAITGRFSDQGKLFQNLAMSMKDAVPKADLMIKSAASYLQAGDEMRAEHILNQAASLAPKDSRSYGMIAVMIYGPRKDTDNIGKTISQGIRNGAPVFNLQLALAEAMHKAGAPNDTKKAFAKAHEALQAAGATGQEPSRPYVSLAETAQRLGFREEAKSALLDALELRPYSSDILNRLAHLSFQENNLDRAAYYFNRYIDLHPDASDAFYNLALAEEGQYRFAQAEKAYRRALELAPEHDGYRRRYENLKARVAQNRRSDS